jgi:metal-responsive CopG/Arc/MetJ family transcriptional regulator
MRRTTISLDEATLRALHDCAAERRISMAELVREAIEEKLARRKVPITFFGIVSSAYTDTGRLAGEYMPEPDPWRS